jgi:hypothetical protein
MLARNHAAELQHLREQFIQRPLRLLAHGRLAVITVRHDVDVHVAIARVTEAGDRKSRSFRERFRKFHQIHQPAARHDDVLIQLR